MENLKRPFSQSLNLSHLIVGGYYGKFRENVGGYRAEGIQEELGNVGGRFVIVTRSSLDVFALK
ncbi:MAG: hypothetical protein ACFFB5_23665 [Promethearchaeota archaeon]